jgi:hypothetical protein
VPNPKIIQIAFFISALLSLNCSHSTGPNDPRQYEWKIDTLRYKSSFQTMMTSIWGSSTKDVWAVGHNSDGPGKMYRWDGIGWNDVKVGVLEGGTIEGAIGLLDITGFSNNDIWVVGEKSHSKPLPPYETTYTILIIHYDGRKWKEINLENYGILSVIWGNSPSDIYIGGTDQIWRYNGQNWSRDSLMLPPPFPGRKYTIYSIAVFPNGNIYAIAGINRQSPYRDAYYFLNRKDTAWVVVDSAVMEYDNNELKWGYKSLWASPGGNLYSAGFGVFIWQNNKWIKILDTWPEPMYKIYGTADNNIFVVGEHGYVYHYNGNDWYQFKQFYDTKVGYRGIWTDGKEVFITGYTYESPNKTVVLRGK